MTDVFTLFTTPLPSNSNAFSNYRSPGAVDRSDSPPRKTPRLSNDSDSAQEILSELQLDGPPSPERIYKEIEEKILLPRSTLPDHWLPTYQM